MITANLAQGAKGDLVRFEGGKVEIDGQNYSKADGELCEQNAKLIADMLGDENPDIIHKPEFGKVKAKQKVQVRQA